MGFQNPIVGGTALRIPAIQSPNYVPGVSGWIIKIDGSAEFNNLTIRGEFRGTNFIINSAGIFLYSGAPAAGNLIGSWANASGTDAYTNTYPQGLSIGSDTTKQIVLNYNGTTSSIAFSVNNGHAQTSGTILEGVVNVNAANEYLSLQLQGPSVHTYTKLVTLMLNSQNEDNSSDANVVISHSTAGNLVTIDSSTFTSLVAAALTNGVTVTGLSALVERAASTDTAIRARVTGDSASRFLVNAGGVATTYANNAFTTYTPTVTNGGTATFTTQTGWSQQVGKMRYFCAYLVVNAAGSGAGNVQIDAPVSIDRTTRQTVKVSLDGVTAGKNGSGSALAFTSGSGATFDRIRDSTNVNITGADLLTGAVITVEGWIREA